MRTIGLLVMRCVTILAATAAPLLGARAAAAQPVRLRVVPDTADVGIGRRLPITVLARYANGDEKEVDDARLAASCGHLEGQTFIGTRLGTCRIAVRWAPPEGRALEAAVVVRVHEPEAAAAPTKVPRPTPAQPEQPALPQFPWPVPRATTRMAIPRGLITRADATQGDRLGDVADSIEVALGRAGLEYGAYAIGDSGFAYVTRVEQIRADGVPVPPPNRFPSGMHATGGGGGFLDFIVSRFRARPGFFRVIAIVVTSRPLTSAAAGLTRDSAVALVGGGMVTLPASLRERIVAQLEGAAFVYEFETRTASDTAAVLRDAPRLRARDHLVGAGLWRATQLGGGTP